MESEHLLLQIDRFLENKWHIPDATMVGRKQFNIPKNGKDSPARPFIVSALKLFSLFSVGHRGTTVY